MQKGNYPNNLDEDLDYRQMWNTLRNELIQCRQLNVQSIHPYIVIGYMNFIQQLAIFDKKDHTDES